MPISPAARKARLILHMDKDRVGMFSGAFFGLVVLIACLYWSYADVYEIVFRVGLTFVVVYVAAFFLVHIFQSDEKSETPNTSGEQQE
jgi:apolipoprotein N-acyltransferase